MSIYTHLRLVVNKQTGARCAEEDVLKSIVEQVGIDKLKSEDWSTARAAHDKLVELLHAARVTTEPSPKTNLRACCTWCGATRTHNVTEWSAHVASNCSPCHPLRQECASKMVNSKSANRNLGNAKREKVLAISNEAEAEANKAKQARLSGAGSSSAEPIRLDGSSSTARQMPLANFLDRQLTDAEVKEIDLELARWCYAEGISFNAMASERLRKALTKLNSTWVAKTRLTDWNLRHSLLDDIAEEQAIAAAC